MKRKGENNADSFFAMACLCSLKDEIADETENNTLYKSYFRVTPGKIATIVPEKGLQSSAAMAMGNKLYRKQIMFTKKVYLT